jgi:hypothetical protein
MKCDNCEKTATRVTRMYRIPDVDLSWARKAWNILRGHRYLLPYYRKAVCEQHYLEYHHGIETFVCPKCGETTLFLIGDLFDMEKIHCCHCGEEHHFVFERDGDMNTFIG